MMPAATHFDPVVGVDVHMIQPPGPVPPVPIPHPYVGMHIDPFDYAPIIGSTILVNGVHRAIAGTAGKAIPPHIPIGGVFVPVLPANEHEAFMGAATVEFDGDAANFMALPCLSCQSIGIPPPPRLNPKKGTKITVPVLPLSVVLPVPKGPPVLIGGPPTISLMSLVTNLIGPFAQIFGMTKAGKKAAAAARRAASRAKAVAKKVWRKAFSWMPPGFIKCKVLKAEPVDLRTGEVVVDQLDFELPGRIPLRWNRLYRSANARIGVCGRGWETPADARLELQADGGVLFLDGEGVGALFDTGPLAGPVREPVDGWVLDRSSTHWTVRKKGGPTWFFPVPAGERTEMLVDAVMDACGNALQFLRGPQGLERVTESAGRRLDVVSRDGLVQRIALHHPDFPEHRVLAHFEYDPERRLVAVHDALEKPYRFAWHADGRLVRHTNRVGLSFHYEYDTAGRCVHSWGDGRLFDYHFGYGPDGRWTNYTDSLGHRWNVELDERGNIVTETDPLGGVTSYAYDEVGRTVGVTDADGHVTTYEYDPHGNLIRLQRADGSSVAVEFDADDRATRVTDANGHVWQYEYNARGLLAVQRSPLGAHWSYAYDERGRISSCTDAVGGVSSFAFDGFGNVTRLGGLGRGVELAHDILGKTVRETRPGRDEVTYAYDRKGRLSRAGRPGGRGVEFEYDPADRLVRRLDSDGRVTEMAYSGLHRLSRKVFADGSSVEYAHDTEERLIAARNENGEIYRLDRDACGRIATETDFWGFSKRYAYTAAGHIARTEAADGTRIGYEVDPLGRVLRRAMQSPGPKAELSVEQFHYDAAGNLVGCENDQGRVEREYDAHGRMRIESNGADFSAHYSFDHAERRTERHIEIGPPGEVLRFTTRYAYDAVGDVAQVEAQGAPAIVFTRDRAAGIVETRFGPSLLQRRKFDRDRQLAAQRVLSAAEVISQQSYRHDPDGNLLERRDDRFGVDTYQNDRRGRLVAHRRNGGPAETFPCDAAGNRVPRRQAGQGYRFDAAGRLVERRDAARELALSWDCYDRVSRCQSGSQSIEYGYDALGRRLLKRGAEASSRFFWSGDELVAELHQSDAADGAASASFKEWFYLPRTFEPLAVRDVKLGAAAADPASRPGRLLFSHNDPNGCPIRLLEEDGSIGWAASHNAWGAVAEVAVAKAENPLRLQGQYHDVESGLHYNRHRYYDPETGTFISKDPLGLLAGLNLYAYGPNVFAWIDPLGLANCRVYRAERIGGRGERIFVDETGKISIPDHDKMLHVSFGTDVHAQYFVEPGQVIKSFEVPEEVVQDIKSRAVRQRDAAAVHKAQIAEAGGAHVNPPPQIDDPKVSRELGRDERDCVGITGTDIAALEAAAIPGSHEIVPTKPKI